MSAKRIRLTIEWDGICREEVWAEVLRELLESERTDRSRLTHVVEIEYLTGERAGQSVRWMGAAK